MYCAKCGSEIPGDARFCPQCGAEAGMSRLAPRPPGVPPLRTGRRMATWKKVVLSVLAFIAVVVALVLYFTVGLVEPIDRQLSALRAGDLEAAYAETSIAFQKATSPEDFAAFVAANPMLKEVADHSFSERSFENDLGTVRGTLKSPDGGALPVEYKLVKEQGAWKILSISLGE